MPAFDYDFQEVINGAVDVLTSRLDNFVRRIGESTRSDAAEVRDIHRNGALLGQQAMMRSYEDSLIPGHAVYKTKTHYGEGALRGALQDDKFIEYADETGIGWGDETHLQGAAKQWRRLNFGAEPASSGVRRVINVGDSSGILNEFLWEGAPTPPFSLPVGLFDTGLQVTGIHPETGRETTIPLGEPPQASYRGQHTGAKYEVLSARRLPQFTEGVEARDFMGDGLAVAMRYVGSQYGKHWENVGKRAYEESGGESTQSYTVNVPEEAVGVTLRDVGNERLTLSPGERRRGLPYGGSSRGGWNI
jgi:hypothetical protein